jgi:hypothetical protein
VRLARDQDFLHHLAELVAPAGYPSLERSPRDGSSTRRFR